MQFCKNCNVKMNNVMSFDLKKHEKFCRCPKCYFETKRQKLDDKELEFKETVYNTQFTNLS